MIVGIAICAGLVCIGLLLKPAPEFTFRPKPVVARDHHGWTRLQIKPHPIALRKWTVVGYHPKHGKCYVDDKMDMEMAICCLDLVRVVGMSDYIVSPLRKRLAVYNLEVAT